MFVVVTILWCPSKCDYQQKQKWLFVVVTILWCASKCDYQQKQKWLFQCLLLLPFCNVPPSVTITLSAKAQINVCCHHFVMCQPVWVSHFAMCQPVSQSANKCLLLLLPFLWCASKCSYHTISRSTNNCLTLSAEAQTDVCCCYCVVMCQQVWL